MKKEPYLSIAPSCISEFQTLRDTMEILSGKWKFYILGVLMQSDALRFMDLLREVQGIGTKMLSKELLDMEMNYLISRAVINTKPVTVEYSLTEYGKNLKPMISEMVKWGSEYRNSIHKHDK